MSYNGYNYQIDNQDFQPYDASANAFAAQGGGFLTNATGFDSPATDTPQKKGKSGSTNQTLTPVTIRQLLLATQSAPEDGFKVDGVTIYQVTIVGTIMSITERNTNMTLSLDDSTGRIDVQIWLDAEDQNDYMNQKRLTWREGLYVRVIGHLRVFQTKRSIVAFRIQPITDFNEITYHFLEATYVHLFHTRGAPSNASQFQSIPAQNNVNSISSGNRWGGNQFSGLHSQVLQVFKSHRSTEGLSIQFVAEQLGKPDYDIRAIVEFLTAEGHLYTTIDEDHFSPTTG